MYVPKLHYVTVGFALRKSYAEKNGHIVKLHKAIKSNIDVFCTIVANTVQHFQTVTWKQFINSSNFEVDLGMK